MRSNSDESEGERSSDNGCASEKQTQPQEWTLENSSLWWLSSDFFQNPGNILIMSSIPFCFGAYYGYARPGNNLEEWVSDLPKESPSFKPVSAGTRATQKAIEREAEIMASRQLGVQLAARAFGIATLGTVGAFGALAGVGFYLSGCRSVSDAMDCTHRWASRQTQSFDDWIGFDQRESKTHPEVVATRNMTEEQEINYVYERLMREIEPGNGGIDTERKS